MRYPMLLAAAMVAGCPLAAESLRVILENSSKVAYGVSDATVSPAGPGHQYRITPMRDQDWVPEECKGAGNFGILRPSGHVSILVEWRGPAHRVVLALEPKAPRDAGLEQLTLVLDPADPLGHASAGVFCISAQGRLHVLNRAPRRPTESAPPAPLSAGTLKVHNRSGRPWKLNATNLTSHCMLGMGHGARLNWILLPRGSHIPILLEPSNFLLLTPMNSEGSGEFTLFDHKDARRFDTVLRAGVSLAGLNAAKPLSPADQTAFNQVFQVSGNTVLIMADDFHPSESDHPGASR